MMNVARSPPSVEAALLMAKRAYGNHASQSSFSAAVCGEGPQPVTQHAIDPLCLGVGGVVVGRADEEARADAPLMTPLARSTLALVSLWYAEPTMRHEPMLLTKARNTSLVKLAS